MPSSGLCSSDQGYISAAVSGGFGVARKAKAQDPNSAMTAAETSSR